MVSVSRLGVADDVEDDQRGPDHGRDRDDGMAADPMCKRTEGRHEGSAPADAVRR